MTKYKELQQAQKDAAKSWYDFRERSWRYYFKFIGGLIDYCAIPDAHLTYLKWNLESGEDRRYTEAEGGSKYTLPGALEFDEEGGFWHLGVSITLSEPGHFPVRWVSFLLCINEIEGKPVVRIGLDGKGQTLDMDDEGQRGALYESIVNQWLKMFAEPRKRKAKTLGFSISSE